MNRHVFESMGCRVVVAGAGVAELDAIERLFRDREATFTRFRAGSELRAVNAARTRTVAVSRTFAEAVSAALAAAAATDGLVDPTLGAALEAAGYTADIQELVPDSRPSHPARAGCWRHLHLTGTLLSRPPGTVLDLNGVVKSMAVDAAVALLPGPGFVSAGGDLATREATVPVALPSGEVIALEAGGIATSGVDKRRWLRGGRVQHHLIDPRTGRPADSPWSHVTAVGRDCLSADVAAKAGFLRGAEGPGWLDALGVAARFRAADQVVENRSWAASTAREATWDSTSSPVDWYAARAAGILAYVLLTLVVLVGLTLAGQLRLPRWPRFAVTDVHRFGGLLVGVFVSIHVGAIALDSYTPFSLSQLVVPFTARYRPLWTAAGIVGLEFLVAIAITNAARGRISYRWWRRIHGLNLAVWAAATVHGIGSGTDTSSAWMVCLYLVSGAGVLAAFAWRLGRRRLGPSAVRRLALAAGLIGVASVGALAALPHGSGSQVSAAPPVALTDSFTGRLVQTPGAAAELLSVTGRGAGSRALLVRIDLVSPDDDSITDTALQLEDVRNGIDLHRHRVADRRGRLSGHLCLRLLHPKRRRDLATRRRPYLGPADPRRVTPRPRGSRPRRCLPPRAPGGSERCVNPADLIRAGCRCIPQGCSSCPGGCVAAARRPASRPWARRSRTAPGSRFPRSDRR